MLSSPAELTQLVQNGESGWDDEKTQRHLEPHCEPRHTREKIKFTHFLYKIHCSPTEAARNKASGNVPIQLPGIILIQTSDNPHFEKNLNAVLLEWCIQETNNLFSHVPVIAQNQEYLCACKCRICFASLNKSLVT